MYDITDAFTDLDKIYEDIETLDNIPEEVKELIKKGVPVLSEEPDFIKEESADLTEKVMWSENQIVNHMGSYNTGAHHVATGKQNLWELENWAGGKGGYKFSSEIRKSADGGRGWYKDHAADLAQADVDASNVKCFICQDTSRVSSDVNAATKKYRDTGEARRNLDTVFRICKYRKNPSLFIPKDNMYYLNRDTNEEGPKPTKDFVFADHDIYEVVYYTYSSYYSDHGYGAREPNIIIISYYLKQLSEIESDIASAEHVFNTDHGKSRTMSRFSNQIDIYKLAKEADSQIVCFVLSFAEQNRKFVIQVDLYNNPSDAQHAYANNSNAFYVGIYNGTSIGLLKGKDTIEKNKIPYIRYIDNNSDRAASPRVEAVINRYGNIINNGLYDSNSNMEKAKIEDIFSIVKDAVQRAERDLIHKGDFVNNLYLNKNTSSNEPIAGVFVQ